MENRRWLAGWPRKLLTKRSRWAWLQQAVAKPILYRSLRLSRHVLLFNSVCYGFAMINMVMAFAAVDNGSTLAPVCSRGATYHAIHEYVAGIIGGVLFAVTLVIYVWLLALTGYRYRGTKWLNSAQRSEFARELQLGAFKSITVIFLAHVLITGTQVIFNGLGTLGLFTWTSDPIYANTFAIAAYIENFSHFFIYFCTNKTFRQAFLLIVRCNAGNAVTPLNVT